MEPVAGREGTGRGGTGYGAVEQHPADDLDARVERHAQRRGEAERGQSRERRAVVRSGLQPAPSEGVPARASAASAGSSGDQRVPAASPAIAEGKTATTSARSASSRSTEPHSNATACCSSCSTARAAASVLRLSATASSATTRASGSIPAAVGSRAGSVACTITIPLSGGPPSDAAVLGVAAGYSARSTAAAGAPALRRTVSSRTVSSRTVPRHGRPAVSARSASSARGASEGARSAGQLRPMTASAVPAPVSSAKRASAATMRPPASARAQPGRGALPGTVVCAGGGVVTLRVLRIGRAPGRRRAGIEAARCLVIIGADAMLAHRDSRTSCSSYVGCCR